MKVRAGVIAMGVGAMLLFSVAAYDWHGPVAVMIFVVGSLCFWIPYFTLIQRDD